VAELLSSPQPIDPAALPRLVAVECTNEPPHPPMWMEYSEEDWYAPPCYWCAYDMQAEAHAGCRHARHWPWRRWEITKRLASWAYSMGLVAGYGITHDGHCDGCVSGFSVGPRARRVYLLGWPAWKWRCLLTQGHWPGQFIGFDRCTKCCPCPECGSTEPDHDVFHGAA
jgi:hypothetical protein